MASPDASPPLLVWAGRALVDAKRELSPNFAVCVQGNEITATGALWELDSLYPDAEHIGSTDQTLLPALVNSHDHGRGLGTARLGVPDDILEAWLPWLGSLHCDPYLAAAYDGVRLARAGVGTVVHSHNAQDWGQMEDEVSASLNGYAAAGLRVAAHLPVVNRTTLVYDDEASFLAGLDPAMRCHAEAVARVPPIGGADFWERCDSLFRRHHDPASHLVHIQAGPANAVWCDDDLVLDAVEFANARGTRVHMHLLETRFQALSAHRRWGTSFIRHLDHIGALGPWLTLAHVVWTEEADLQLLATRGVKVVVNPSSNMRLKSGSAPISEMMAAGMTVGVGLDGLGLNDDQDYVHELKLAWQLASQKQTSAPTVTEAGIWHAATSGGIAVAFGDEVPLGELKPGRLADLTLVDTPTMSTRSLDGLLATVTRNDVRHVMVNGRWIVRDGQATGVDESEVLSALWESVPTDHRSRLDELQQRLRPFVQSLRDFYATWDRDCIAYGWGSQ